MDRAGAVFIRRGKVRSQYISWDGDRLMTLIEAFETDRRNKPITNIGRRSPDPRLISLNKLLQAQRTP